MAQGILLVYDITMAKSFENIQTWIKNIEQHASEDVEKMILGNKCDMNDKRAITTEQGQAVRGEHAGALQSHFSAVIQRTLVSRQRRRVVGVREAIHFIPNKTCLWKRGAQGQEHGRDAIAVQERN